MVDRVADWSNSASGNTSVAGVSIAENCPVANLNNMGREIMAAIRGEFSEQGATVVAAALTTISGASEFKPLLGNTTITAFDTAVTGMYRELKALGTPLLVNSAALALKGGANLTLQAGDLLRNRSLGAGNWIVQVDRADGSPLNNPVDIGSTVTAASLTDISSLPVLKPLAGTTTIDGFTTAQTGTYRETRVLSAPLMKHNATSNIIPGSANITLAANDLLRSRSLGAGKWLHKIDRGDGTAIAVAAVAPTGTVSFSAKKATDQSVTGAVATKIIFATEEWDDNSLLVSSTFTPTSGKWRISACVQGVLVSTIGAVAIILYKNGAAYKYGGISKGNTGGFESGSVLDVIVSANGTDTFEIYVLSESDVTISGTTTRAGYFQGQQVA